MTGKNTEAAVPDSPSWAKSIALLACLFGVLTVFSGGAALYGENETRSLAGDIVPFVLWFNFIGGFLYIAAGVGMYLWKAWSVKLALFIATASVLILAGLIWHILSGLPYEMRTLGAMTFRSCVWLAIAYSMCRAMRAPF